MDRESVIKLFSDFAKANHLGVRDYLTIMDCCVRETAATVSRSMRSEESIPMKGMDVPLSVAETMEDRDVDVLKTLTARLWPYEGRVRGIVYAPSGKVIDVGSWQNETLSVASIIKAYERVNIQHGSSTKEINREWKKHNVDGNIRTV